MNKLRILKMYEEKRMLRMCEEIEDVVEVEDVKEVEDEVLRKYEVKKNRGSHMTLRGSHMK
jgi:hypothetical protein